MIFVDDENQKVIPYRVWITLTEGRIAKLHEHTYYEGGILKIGQRVECKDESGIWNDAYILELTNTNVSRIKMNSKHNFIYFLMITVCMYV